MIFEVLIGLLGFLFSYYLREWKLNKTRPPGPFRLPVLGSMIQMIQAHPTLPYRAFEKLSNIYGDFMCVRIGFLETVVLSSYEISKDLLVKDELSGRFLSSFIKSRSWQKERGLIFSSGNRWKDIRRFTVRNLRDFGFGKISTMEDILDLELEEQNKYIEEEMERNNGKVHFKGFFNITVLNILWSMLAGYRFNHRDEKLKKLMVLIENLFKSGNFGASVAQAFPTLIHIFPRSTGFTDFTESTILIRDFCQEVLENSKASEYKTSPSNFLEVCLQEMEKEKADSNINFENVLITILDLLLAGSETTSNNLSFAILFMILYPEVQKKVQNEIDVTFPTKLPNFGERDMLPYTQATLLEIIRYGDVVPLPPQRKAMEDVKYGKYTIKKGVVVTCNIHKIFTEKSFWGDPQNFRPERFLDTHGNIDNVYAERIATFGFGKRICPGENLARTSMFIYFTSLMKKFTFSRAEGEVYSEEPVFGFTQSPRPFNCIIKKRI